MQPARPSEHVQPQIGANSTFLNTVALASTSGALSPRSTWAITADSSQAGNPPAAAFDDNPATFFHSEYSPQLVALPHYVVIDMTAPFMVNGLTYLPRQDGTKNGNVGQYTVELSTDGASWTTVATGTFADDATLKEANFAVASARYVRFTSLTEAGGRGPWMSAAEINLLAGSASVSGALSPESTWAITADSSQAGNPPAAAFDDNPATFFHSEYSPQLVALPHYVVIDMTAPFMVNGLTYLPRQDGTKNGNVGQYTVELSTDGASWTTVATGTFADDATLKEANFAVASARYVRFTSLTEAGGRGPWMSAAEINLLAGSASVSGALSPESTWAITADSSQAGNPPAAAFDDNPATFFHSEYSPQLVALPHYVVIDMTAPFMVNGLTYLPRQDGTKNGNVGQYTVELSTDGASWTTVATGTFADDATLKEANFAVASARYVRFTSLTEAGGRGPWMSAAEINLLAGSASVSGALSPESTWAITADSSQAGNPPAAAFDDNPATFFHSEYSPQLVALPHYVVIDMTAPFMVNGLTYLPRQDGTKNGNVGQYTVELSTDGASWTTVATGTFADDATLKEANFAVASARYVRFTSLTEAGGRGPWMSAAEINLLAGSASVSGALSPESTWAITADSSQAGNPPAAAFDDNPATFFHSEYSPQLVALPHYVVIDMTAPFMVNGLTYLPRQDGTKNGNVGQYTVELSTDGASWTTVATGTFADDATLKEANFAVASARYVRFTSLTEAGGRGPWMSAAEINLLAGSASVSGALSPESTWAITADSYQAGAPPAAAFDDNSASIFHSEYSPQLVPLPHFVVIDMTAPFVVNGLTYLPRQDGNPNGNVGQHTIELSTDGTSWTTVATGTFADDATLKQATFANASARYVRFTSITEAGNRGPWMSAAEINVLVGSVTNPFTIAVDSEEVIAGNFAGEQAFDYDLETIWHTRYSGAQPLPGFPHTFTVDMKKNFGAHGLTYWPRQDGSMNGNIGGHTIDVSLDGTNWLNVATGTFLDNQQSKVVTFDTRLARYVRLTALTEAGGRGPWTSAAEIRVSFTDSFTPPAAGLGQWGITIDFPIIPVAAGLLETGKMLTWSSYLPESFGGSGNTFTATYDPAAGSVSQHDVVNTGHDMFCPGISINTAGHVVVTGGDDSSKTSFYDPMTNGWASGPPLNIPRGYQATATLSDGRIFIIGGSWSGGLGGKNGEVLNAAGTSWTLLPGCDVTPMLTADAQGVYRADNHGWLFGWKQGWVFQAGPSQAMNWYNPSGNGGTGSVAPAGKRGTDSDAMNGNAVMYDAVNGLILTLGGAPDYQDSQATANANVIRLDSSGTAPTVTPISSMSFARSFANAVVLPDGKVFVTGGQSYALPFSDDTAVYHAELWDPATMKFTVLPTMDIPRNYHSVALLLPDATVFNGGGGLCGDCATNHFDGQIYSPAYLFNTDGTKATRPVIKLVVPTSVTAGASFSAMTDVPISEFSLIRSGSNTHTVDTDQRRIAVTLAGTFPNYTLQVPSDTGIALPGYWMLFALNAGGVPSVATVVNIR